MGRKPNEVGGAGRRCSPSVVLLLVAFVTCSLVYTGVSLAFRRTSSAHYVLSLVDAQAIEVVEGGGAAGEEDAEEERGDCCRGVENLELWGSAVKWGTDFKFNTSRECCKACKAMCHGGDGPCLCDSWVFCGDREKCKDKFGQCWLKKQKDALFPDLQESGENVIWTSGLIFGKGEGIVGIETEYGTLHLKLFPECAPRSVSYIVELLGARHCAGCRFYRAEGRGHSWDEEGNHIADAPPGPPYGLIQGTLEAEGVPFKKVPAEACPTIRRGSVAWIGSGPEFFVSLASHNEWRRSYTVFGTVLPEDMAIAEKIAQLPTKSDVWSNVNVSILEKPVPLKFRRLSKSGRDLNLKTNADLHSSKS
uniref:Peptidyl-prolyl cis-trans isomerase-like 3 n=1 Tax=Anthurium amnicola TaxID=1678845 RepID=A0A1D1XUQ3_9ARAE